MWVASICIRNILIQSIGVSANDRRSFMPGQWLSDAAVNFGILYEEFVGKRDDSICNASRYYMQFVNNAAVH